VSTIPMLDLRREYEWMKAEIDEAIGRCLTHQQWILGPEVREFEAKAAEYLGVEHCIGVSSGTEALVLGLRALAIKTKGREYFEREDEVVTTPFTFVATGDAILRAGATPVFVDIDPATFNLSTDALSDCLARGGGHVVGVLPVHLFGGACDMSGVTGTAERSGLFVLEDVAQAFGGVRQGHRLGSIGTLGAFSFFPSKNLGCFGDGGMCSTKDGELAELIRMLLKHGGRDKYNCDYIGYNARLDTLQAAVLLVRLRHVEEFNARRSQLAAWYADELAGVGELTLPQVPAGVHHVFHQYTVRVSGGRRDKLAEHLKAQGVGSMVYYPVPLHRMKVFADRARLGSGLSAAEAAAAEVLSLPIEPLLERGEVASIGAAVRGFFGK
jgi:UDP-2-acetamido-2-deoxy-ribo-hexuluronate aminotransferase